MRRAQRESMVSDGEGSQVVVDESWRILAFNGTQMTGGRQFIYIKSASCNRPKAP